MNQRESHIEDLKEWQKKQYLPGYYVGGRIPPIFKQRTKGLGYGLVSIGIFFILLGLIMIFLKESAEAFLHAGWFSTIGLLFLLAGINVIRKLRTKPQQNC